MKRSLIALAALPLLASCSGAPTPTALPSVSVQSPVVITQAKPAADPLKQLAQFTLSDLQNASALAHKNNDQTAWQCYDYLIKVVPTLPNFSQAQPLGAFTAFQQLRDLQSGVTQANGALRSLNLACAPLVIDTQTTINKLLLIGAGSAATAGTLAPLAPVVGATLP